MAACLFIDQALQNLMIASYRLGTGRSIGNGQAAAKHVVQLLVRLSS
jgi:hypothetical protein